MSATQRLLSLDPKKSVVPFGDGTNHQFHHSDMDHLNQPSGISCEEGDFLYGLVRVLRPTRLFETGTNYGCSASFMALALKDNGMGHLDTIEHNGTLAQIARSKLKDMGLDKHATVHCCKVSEFHPRDEPDFLFLDSELDQRYAELLRFYPLITPGGVACIHDLPAMDFDQFGGIPDDLRFLILRGNLRALTFATPHGLTVFQKRREHDTLADIMIP